MDKMAYSYHNFFYPFHIKEGIGRSFKAFLNKRKEWNELKLEDKQQFKDEDVRLFYNSYQYFNDVGRKALYGNMGYSENKSHSKGKQEIVVNYIYKIDKKSRYTYKIVKEVKNNAIKKYFKKEYVLHIERITLSVYNTDIGILCIETNNSDYSSIEDIMRINDLGRRVSIACIGADPSKGEKRFSTAADRLSLSVNLQTSMEDDFQQEIKKVIKDADSMLKGLRNDIELNGCSNIIEYLLVGSEANRNENSKENKKTVFFRKMATEDKEGDKAIIISPIMDDRMFTQCLVNSERYSEMASMIFKQPESSNEKKWFYTKFGVNGLKAAKELLYQIVFLDSENCSCQNDKMLDESLERNIYKRWSNDETVYGITQHSFVCISNENGKEAVFYPFMTMYRDMTRLVIAQRASIIALAKKATQISDSVNSKASITTERINEIQKLQKEYVACQNQILHFEVTTQLQGIELYEKFQKEFFVKEQKEQLESQLTNLYEIANMEANNRLNTIVLCLTIASVGLALFPIVKDGICELGGKGMSALFQIIGIPFLLVCSLFLVKGEFGSLNVKKIKITMSKILVVLLAIFFGYLLIYCYSLLNL